jgi:hypothetical protein
MKNIFTLIFAFLCLGLSAQLTITPGTMENTIPLTGDYIYYMTIKNTSSTDQIVHWQVNKDANTPSTWSIYVCDNNLCYSPSVIKNPANKPNTIAANSESIFKVYVNPGGTAGSAITSLSLFADAAHANFLVETDVNGVITAGSPNSTFHAQKDDISVYPNPTDSYFSLKNTSNVSKLVLFNVVGREVKRFNSIATNYFDVSDLNRGYYLVKAIDAKGKTLKTIKLSIR